MLTWVIAAVLTGVFLGAYHVLFFKDETPFVNLNPANPLAEFKGSTSVAGAFVLVFWAVGYLLVQFLAWALVMVLSLLGILGHMFFAVLAIVGAYGLLISIISLLVGEGVDPLLWKVAVVSVSYLASFGITCWGGRHRG